MRRALCASALILAACGGSSPSAPTSPSTAPPLTPGRYSLGVVISGNGMEGLQPACTIGGAGDPNDTIPMPLTGFVVNVTSDGTGGVIVRPERQFDLGFEMRLRSSSTGLAGTMQGVARDMVFPQTVMVDGGADGTPATLTGNFGFIYNDVGGRVTGRVRFDRGGWLYSCPFNDWIMNRM